MMSEETTLTKMRRFIKEFRATFPEGCAGLCCERCPCDTGDYSVFCTAFVEKNPHMHGTVIERD